ncbi:hypothetical protein [Lysobacter gummosus]|uniref:hypothetical protein n=1 Tax=Lysobacter gummosus TaxID=262324 RepID=UPI00362A434E
MRRDNSIARPAGHCPMKASRCLGSQFDRLRAPAPLAMRETGALAPLGRGGRSGYLHQLQLSRCGGRRRRLIAVAQRRQQSPLP